MGSEGRIIIIEATCATEAEATSIARELLQTHLAACVQLSPIQSLYRWNDKLEESRETRLSIKTRRILFKEVAELIRSRSSYECPQIISYAVEQGAEPYLAWVEAETCG